MKNRIKSQTAQLQLAAPSPMDPALARMTRGFNPKDMRDLARIFLRVAPSIRRCDDFHGRENNQHAIRCPTIISIYQSISNRHSRRFVAASHGVAFRKYPEGIESLSPAVASSRATLGIVHSNSLNPERVAAK